MTRITWSESAAISTIRDFGLADIIASAVPVRTVGWASPYVRFGHVQYGSTWLKRAIGRKGSGSVPPVTRSKDRVMMQFLQILVIVGAIGGMLFLLWRPYWVFVLIVCMWPVEQLITSYVPALSYRTTLINLIIGSLAVLAVFTRLFKRDPILQAYKNPVTVLTLLFYLLWLLGIVYAPQVAKDYVLEGLTTSLSYQGLFLLLLPLVLLNVAEFRQMLGGVMLLGAAVAVLIMANPNSAYHSGRLVLDLGMVGGGISQHGNPLALGEMGGMLALMAALVRPARVSPLYNLLRVAAFVSGMGLAIGSGSRGQVLAAGICGVAFFPVARRLASVKHFFFGVIGFCVLVVGIYAVFKLFVGQQNQQRWEVFGMLRDTSLRLTYVWELLSEWLAHPEAWLFGLGTNAYVAISPDRALTYVHNIAAEALCEHGIVGAVLFVSIMWLTIRCGYSLWSAHKNDDSMRSTVAILLAVSAYYLLLSLKQGSLSSPAPFYWWLVLAKFSTQERLSPAFGSDPDMLLPRGEDVLDRSPEEQDADARGYALGY